VQLVPLLQQVSPAGDVWVVNNWQGIDSCFGTPDENALDPLWWPGRGDFFGMPKLMSIR